MNPAPRRCARRTCQQRITRLQLKRWLENGHQAGPYCSHDCAAVDRGDTPTPWPDPPAYWTEEQKAASARLFHRRRVDLHTPGCHCRLCSADRKVLGGTRKRSAIDPDSEQPHCRRCRVEHRGPVRYVRRKMEDGTTALVCPVCWKRGTSGEMPGEAMDDE